jgi:hypothetical protein
LSRVTRFKLGYAVALLTLGGGVVAYSTFAAPPAWAIATLIVVLLLPGRIQGLLFRDLFRGRRHLDRNDAASALRHLNSFLVTIRSQPWRKPALWLSWSIYTPSVEAMAHNNIGTAFLALGDAAAAEAAWHAALDLDSQYPIPHANLALVAAARNDPAAASHHLDMARRLGYSGAAFDRFAHKTQSILAAVESHGPSA